jgi:hypothetical protein
MLHDLTPHQKPEVPRLYHTSVDGAYSHFVNKLGITFQKYIVLDLDWALEGMAYAFEPRMVRRDNAIFLIELALKDLKRRKFSAKGRVVEILGERSAKQFQLVRLAHQSINELFVCAK